MYVSMYALSWSVVSICWCSDVVSISCVVVVAAAAAAAVVVFVVVVLVVSVCVV